jgi:branched-subunit amino acid aminotransferase/4-amino-4-deoxychorismate lyase
MRIFNGNLAASVAGPAEPEGAVGVFETALLRAGEPQFFEEHFARYAAGCGYFSLGAAAPDAAALREAAARLRDAVGIADGVLRWSAWREAGGTVNWQLTVEPPRPHMVRSVWTAMNSARRLPDPGPESVCKHLGRRLWREALVAARAQGFDEVLLSDRLGRVVEGAVSNVFCVTDGRVRTPAVACGPLPGTARGRVIRLARQIGVAIEEGGLTPADLCAAQELFVTNALVGIRPLAALDGVPFVAPGPVTARLQAAWSGLADRG